MSIFIERYKNNNSKLKSYGRTYGRVKTGRTLNTRKVAEHIAGHGSIYTLDIIEGVLAKLEHCLPELLKQGYQVKLEGLGTFYLSAKTIGEENAEDFTLNNVKHLGIKFLPEQSEWSGWKAAAARTGAELVLTNYVVLEGASKESNRRRTLQYLTNDTITSSGGSQDGGDSGDDGNGEEDRP